MHVPPASLSKVMVIAASAFGLISCVGARPEKIADVPRSSRIGTTIVASASMNAPQSVAATSAPETIRSCAGPSLCREDSLTTTDPDALTDVEEACARVGGTFASVLCPRAAAAARCSRRERVRDAHRVLLPARRGRRAPPRSGLGAVRRVRRDVRKAERGERGRRPRKRRDPSVDRRGGPVLWTQPTECVTRVPSDDLMSVFFTTTVSLGDSS